MTQETPLLLPTTVIGSHATPSWLWTSIAEIEKGNYGETDIKETFDDAVMIAITDQERAGIDIITDGEMRRWYFVQSFYRRMENLIERPPLRKVGVYGYDSPKRYIATDKVSIPDGLGITEEAWDVVVGVLLNTLGSFNVEEGDIQQIVGAVGSKKSFMVTQ